MNMTESDRLPETLQKLREIITKSTKSYVPVQFLDSVEVAKLSMKPGDVSVVRQIEKSDNALDIIYDKHDFFETLKAFQEISPKGVNVIGLWNKAELQIVVND